jgi:hypothetical protein
VLLLLLLSGVLPVAARSSAGGDGGAKMYRTSSNVDVPGSSRSSYPDATSRDPPPLTLPFSPQGLPS